MNRIPLLIISLLFTLSIIPSSEAHILIVANGDNTTPDSYQVVKNTADVLKSNGYDVLELYGENATTKNIIKGMYNADAMIYAGHGVFLIGNYDENGGIATPPFGIVGSDGIIWGYGDEMKEENSGKSFKAPFKKNIPVILFGACFSSGWVETSEVANPTETIYSFSRMFTGAGANYYATAYIRYYKGKEVVDLVAIFLNGASSMVDANKKNYGFTINQKTDYENQSIWRNNHGYNAFVGNWNGTFPHPSKTTLYNDTAAEKWYDGSLPNPSGELDNSQPNPDGYIDELMDELCGWIYFFWNSLWNSDIPEINLTFGSKCY